MVHFAPKMKIKKSLSVLIFTVAMTLITFTNNVLATRHCSNCGHIAVPYPLSSATGCGHPSYKVRCDSSTLWFDALNASSYVITSIDPFAQRLIIRPPGLARGVCVSADFFSNGIQLDPALPFNITASNTVLRMNCTDYSVQQIFASQKCSSTSVCHDYIRGNGVARAACGGTKNCCWFKTGGSLNAYRIPVREDRCSAYQSFVNLDIDLPVREWPEPGVELEWGLPREPICKIPDDCQDLADSACQPDPLSVGQRRCFCHSGFQWDPINGVCKGGMCRNCNRRRKKSKTTLFVVLLGTALSAAAILLGILTMVLVQRRRHCVRKDLAESSASKVRERILNCSNSGLIGRVFSSKEIVRATNNFSKDNLLGSGGFGEVFKGIIDDGTITAIKRAKLGNAKGIDQILNEVRILCQVNHRSLVRLLGCCIEFEQPVLVYEYISSGTLFDHLHRYDSEKRCILTWHRRLVIAHQAAECLAYLHSSATPPIYHRDIKSSNILLDDNLDAKISDFGLSRLAANDESHITTSAQGTLGYLDPEYYINFRLTDKSDVYSFGVVLLELLTSKKAIDFNREEEDVNLVVYVRKILSEERLLDVIDPVLKEGASKLELESMKAFGCLAAACLDEKRQNRPSMKGAANEIEYIIRLVTTDAPED